MKNQSNIDKYMMDINEGIPLDIIPNVRPVVINKPLEEKEKKHD
jgi:hypothetical protein